MPVLMSTRNFLWLQNAYGSLQRSMLIMESIAPL